MRRALIVGIDHYNKNPLTSCINDADKITNYLERHGDGQPNFDCKTLVSSSVEVTRPSLKKEINLLFANNADIALLYFSGHGYRNEFGGFLVTQDATENDEGVSMNDIMIMANQAKTREVIIILDCCYSGSAGNDPFTDKNVSLLREGVSIITSSRQYQLSMGTKNGHGALTKVICQALDGSGSDILGNITIADIYNYADKMLSSWDQRPIMKSHISTMTPIRKVSPTVPIDDLRKLPHYFLKEDSLIELSKEHEPTEKPKNEEKEAIFSDLQKFNSVGLVKPIGEDHMYYAAVNSKPCKLTPLGEFYWDMARRNRI